MGFSRLKAASASAPAPTTPAPVVAQAPAPVQTPAPQPTPVPAPILTPTQVSAPAPKPSGLIIPTVARSSLALIAKETEGTFTDMFPTIMLKGGNSGGSMVPTSGTDKEIAKLLPQGKQPIQGVFMAYRTLAIAWPEALDDSKEKNGERPCIDCAIPANDTDNTALLLTGCENFQFAPKEVKQTKWSFKAGGPGLIRPIMEILVYLPQFDDIIVLRSSSLLKTYHTLGQQLTQYVNESNGELGVFPASFEVTTDTWYEDNVFHYWKITSMVNDVGAANFAKYNAFVESIRTNRPDMMQDINDWFTGADKPITADYQARLKQAANMTNPRRRRA